MACSDGTPRQEVVQSSGVVPATAAVSTQEYGTMLGTYSATQVFFQNTTSEFGTGSTKLHIPFDAGGLAITNSTLAQLSLIYSFPGGIYPMVNITQGAACQIGITCWNVTVPYEFTVYPTVSTTNVQTTIPAAFTIGGATPPVAAYTVPVTALTQLQFSILSTATWAITAGTTESTSYVVTVPAGYTLNLTQVFIPWPTNVAVNSSSLSLTLGGTAITSVQVVAGGFYVIIPGIATTKTLSATVTINGAQAGGWTRIQVGKAYLDGKGQQYQANASWVNPNTIPYGGGFLLTTNFSYPVNPVNLTILENGKVLKSTNYFLAGTIIEILPSTLLIPGGGVLVLQITLYFIGAPPVYTASLTTPLFGAVTVGDVLVTGLLLLSIYIVLSAATTRKRSMRWSFRSQSNGWIGAVFLFVLLLAILVYFILTGNAIP
jgi:hypothetical protein